MPAPAFALRLLLGEMADALLLSGQRAVPAKAERLGFRFRFTQLDDALRAIFPQDDEPHDEALGTLVANPAPSQPSGCQFARPTRYFSPVGAGTPPSGSMVTATAATLATSRGVVNTAWTSPLSPGLSSPALTGASGVTIHT